MRTEEQKTSDRNFSKGFNRCHKNLGPADKYRLPREKVEQIGSAPEGSIDWVEVRASLKTE